MSLHDDELNTIDRLVLRLVYFNSKFTAGVQR